MSSIFQKMHSKNLWKTKYQVNRLLLPLTNFFNRKTGAHNQAFESEKQELFMDHENCILVDENDKNIGFASKRDCHELKNNGLRLHRAFSVFLFNNNGEMLLQKRSNNKITFPNLYSNACCSHPLDNIENEREETNAIGVKRAAQRRLNYELGIPLDQIQPENFNYLTRLVYYFDQGDGVWGEHEIDYILILHKDVDVQPNPGEVSDIHWIRKENFEDQIKSLDAPLTPWFNMFYKSGRLIPWWENLHQLKKCEDHKIIHKLN